MVQIKCISVSEEFSKIAKEHNLSWSEAARVGMGILMAEAGITEYDNKLNLFRKMRLFQKQAEEALQKLAILEEKESLKNGIGKTETII